MGDAALEVQSEASQKSAVSDEDLAVCLRVLRTLASP